MRAANDLSTLDSSARKTQESSRKHTLPSARGNILTLDSARSPRSTSRLTLEPPDDTPDITVDDKESEAAVEIARNDLDVATPVPEEEYEYYSYDEEVNGAEEGEWEYYSSVEHSKGRASGSFGKRDFAKKPVPA